MNLIYTVAFDPPGSEGNRTLAKLLCSSLLRSCFSGHIVVFRNTPHPLFAVERKNVIEIYVDPIEWESIVDYQNPEQFLLNRSLEARFRLSSFIVRPEQYDWIVYIDADCLALRDIEHLFTAVADAEILVQPEKGRSLAAEMAFNGYLPFDYHTDGFLFPGEISRRNHWLGKIGVNAGTFAIRGSKFQEFVQQWEAIYQQPPVRHGIFRDQTAFNKLLLTTNLRVLPFERGEIMFPFHLDKDMIACSQAALLHFVGGGLKNKVGISFGFYMTRVYGEEAGLILNLLES